MPPRLSDWLLQTSRGQLIERLIHSRNESLHAPHLIDLEVAQVFRRLVAEPIITEDRADEAMDDLEDLRITRYPHYLFLRRIWQLRHNLSAYDAAYVARAERLESPLVTRDGRLAGASGHTAKVRLF
ncbi:MAG: type II toxin-antitoxin system VapC family toxin [Candidatus Sulfotelmatobacter sp.]